MRKIYLAFLGIGPRKGDKNEYDETVYELNGISASPTKFVQAAEIELIINNRIQLILIYLLMQKEFILLNL